MIKSLTAVMPWCDRDEIVQSIPQIASKLGDLLREVIIVNCGGDLAYLKACRLQNQLETVRVFDLPAIGRFNKSLALNHGVQMAESANILLLDADVLPSRSYIERATSRVETTSCFVVARRTLELDRSRAPAFIPKGEVGAYKVTETFTLCSGRTASVTFACTQNGVRSGNGIVVLRKADFSAVGGMNSELNGWGFEDMDLQLRLQMGLGTKRVSLGVVRHISHPRMSGAASSHELNRDACLKRYQRGNFMGTLANDLVVACTLVRDA